MDTKTRNRLHAADAYTANLAGCETLLNEIRDHLADMPAPDDDCEIRWVRAEAIADVRAQLADIRAFFSGDER